MSKCQREFLLEYDIGKCLLVVAGEFCAELQKYFGKTVEFFFHFMVQYTQIVPWGTTGIHVQKGPSHEAQLQAHHIRRHGVFLDPGLLAGIRRYRAAHFDQPLRYAAMGVGCGDVH